MEDMDPGVERYLCAVAATNGAGHQGPMTPANGCLPLPNPCAVCGPGPQARPMLGELARDMRGLARGADGGPASMTLTEPGKRPMRVPLMSAQGYGGEAHGGTDFIRFDASGGGAFAGAMMSGNGAAARLSNASPAFSGFSEPVQGWGAWDGAGARAGAAPGSDGRQPSPSLSGFASNSPPPSASAFAALGAAAAFADDSAQFSQEDVERDIIAQRLKELTAQLDSSLFRYRQVGAELARSPDDEFLRRAHEEAEIEAAGHQAEVAVLSQHLEELDAALRARPRQREQRPRDPGPPQFCAAAGPGLGSFGRLGVDPGWERAARGGAP
mmetsp:Transcript_24148/g.67842  ORF Transcript_24148/g.67842 Transcript_24148/m.67842 type:complete len:327 (-) Transcript_24148:29-1009(-)